MPKANGVQCPFCKTSQSSTTDSRPHLLGRRRRYLCKTCKERFSTIEIVLPSNVTFYRLKRIKSVKTLLALIISDE